MFCLSVGRLDKTVPLEKQPVEHKYKLHRIINCTRDKKQLIMQLFYKKDLGFLEDHKVKRSQCQTALKREKRKKNKRKKTKK